METIAKEYLQLKNKLNMLGLLQMEANLDQLLESVTTKEMTLVAALNHALDAELDIREIKKRNHLIQLAGFPFEKTFEEFDFSFQPVLDRDKVLSLKDLSFVDRHENILFIGSPGVGKTHLSIALGLECIKNEKSTYFIHCSELIEQLTKAAKDNKLEGKLRFLNRYAVLIIDEVGFIPFSPEAANYLFQLLSRRYEKKSLIITTNKPISQWGEMFGDPALANALLDRLLHHSKVIKIPGRSYRTKDLVSELEERRRES